MKYYYGNSYKEAVSNGPVEIKSTRILQQYQNAYSVVIPFLEEMDYPRTCSHCGNGMREGYCIEGGQAYYCSDECLHANMTQEEYLNLYDEGNGDSYYTEWEEEDNE